MLQFIKFGLVGVSNTLINYGIDMLCYYVLFARVTWANSTKALLCSALAFLVSVTNSFYWNNRYVFKSEGQKSARAHLAAYAKTVLCYGVTGLILAPVLKIWIVSAGIPYWLASVAPLILTIPLNYFLNKYWAFGDKKRDKQD